MVTPEELALLPDGDAFELVDGKLVEKNVSALSSLVEIRVSVALELYRERTGRGCCFPCSLGYQILPWDPERVVRPDASYLFDERVPEMVRTEGYLRVTPDLVVEVLSKNDLIYAVDAKIEDYLRAGVKLVWIINPQKRTIMIHRPDGTTTKLREADRLEGEDVLEGFSVPAATLFPTYPSGEHAV